MKRLLVALCLAVFFSGCISMEGTKMEPIAIGMTMEQVRENFGAPDEVPQAGEDGQLWEYDFVVPDDDGDIRTKTAHIHFNEYGEVEQINDLPGKYIKTSY